MHRHASVLTLPACIFNILSVTSWFFGIEASSRASPRKSELTPLSLRLDALDMNCLARSVVCPFHTYFLPRVRSQLLLIVDLICRLLSCIIECVLTYHLNALPGALLSIFGLNPFHHSIVGAHGGAWTVHNFPCKQTAIVLG